MKFLICGIGSAGQRHYKNLQKLGHCLALFRSRQHTTPFIDRFFEEQKKSGQVVEIFYDLEEALRVFKPDGVFVTNPISSHIPVALTAARAGCHLFVEKPISHTLEGIDELTGLVLKNSLRLMVGYNFRFHPLLREMKTLCDGGAIGTLLSAHAELVENIDDWHPWEDYRDCYAAYKSGGSGAALNFSHGIDLLYWFFGMPERVFAVGGKLTPLTGDVDDMLKSVLEFGNGVIASLYLDIWQRPPRHWLEVIGTEGKLLWDYYDESLTLTSRDKPPIKKTRQKPAGFTRNDTFVDEAEDFIRAIQDNREPSITLGHGIDVLNIALEILKQLRI